MKILLQLQMLVFGFFVCLGTHSFSQTVKCQVLEKHTYKPIPYATIFSTLTDSGLHTDEQGYFEWDKTKKLDTLILSCVGFKTQKQLTQSLLSSNINLIELSTETIVLNEITVRPGSRKVSKEIGFYHHSTDYATGMAAGGISDNQVFLNYFNNTEQQEGQLSQVMFDLKSSSLGQSSSKVRIRIMEVDKKTGLPGKDLLAHDLIRKISPFNHNVVVSIKEQNVIFPPEGIFIGLEFICNTRFIYRREREVIKKQKSNCPLMPMAREKAYNRLGKGYYWTKYRNKWQWVCLSDGSVFLTESYVGMVFKFGAKIDYYVNK